MGPHHWGTPPGSCRPAESRASHRRLLLLGPIAMWAASAAGPLRGAASKPADNTRTQPSPPAGREGTTITPAVNTNVVREIHFDRPGRVADHMAWSADGERLAVGGALDLRMSVLDVRTGRQLPTPGEQLGGVKGLAYSPDGRYLAVIRGGTGLNADAPRYTVSLWDAQTSALARVLIEPDRTTIESILAHGLTFSSDGHYLATMYLKQTAVYAVAADGDIQRVVILPRASRCAFRPGADVLACLSMGLGTRTLTLYRLPDGQVTAQFDLPATNLGWSGDGHLLATTNGQHVNIHDMTGGHRVSPLSVADPDARFQSVSFSPDGRWFAAASDRRVDLWETTSWSHATTLGHQRQFVSVATFAPRESLLGIVGYAPATIWNVQPR